MLKSVDIQRCKIVRDTSVTYDSVECAADVNNLLRMLGYADSPEEYFVLVCLNCRGDIVGIHEVSHGDLSMTVVSMRSIFMRACVNSASSIIVAHNHPSGCSEPSDEDIATTKRLVKAGEIMGIPVVDHIIITVSNFTSFREEGLM